MFDLRIGWLFRVPGGDGRVFALTTQRSIQSAEGISAQFSGGETSSERMDIPDIGLGSVITYGDWTLVVTSIVLQQIGQDTPTVELYTLDSLMAQYRMDEQQLKREHLRESVAMLPGLRKHLEDEAMG